MAQDFAETAKKISELKICHPREQQGSGVQQPPPSENSASHLDWGYVPCPFSELGCAASVSYKDLERHIESSMLYHMNILAKSHKTLLAEHKALLAEHRALQSEFKKLQPEHKALLAEHKTLVTEYSILHNQFKSRLPVMKNRVTSNQFYVFSHVSTLEIDGPPAVLAVAEFSVKNGQHYFIVSGHKISIKWKEATKLEEGANGLLMFTLSLIESSPAPASASSFDIEIQVSDSPSVQSTGKVNFSCCCLPGRRPNSLLGAFFRPASSPKDKVMLFRFHTHQPTGPLGCRCSCHKSVKK